MTPGHTLTEWGRVVGVKRPPKPRRGLNAVEVEGAIVFRGNVTIFKSAKHLGRFFIVADSHDSSSVELVEQEKSK